MSEELENLKRELEVEKKLRIDAEKRVSALLEERSRFASIAAHDLKSPLNTISSYSQLLNLKYKNNLEKEPREWLEFISKAVLRMSQMLDALLEYSYTESQERMRTWESLRPPR